MGLPKNGTTTWSSGYARSTSSATARSRSTAERTLNAVAIEVPMSIESTPRRSRSSRRISWTLGSSSGCPTTAGVRPCRRSVTAPISQLPTWPVTSRKPRPPRRLAARTRASSSKVVIRGVNASLRRRHTSIVARPYSKNTARARRSASRSDTASARRKLSAMPRRVSFRVETAIPLPTVEMAWRTGRGSQRAP